MFSQDWRRRQRSLYGRDPLGDVAEWEAKEDADFATTVWEEVIIIFSNL
jgi:hypothetical protein